jgi:polysaccharide biosynthesis transport protein
MIVVIQVIPRTATPGDREGEPLDLRSQIAVVRAWLPLFVAGFVLAAIAAYVVSVQLPAGYEARATLVVGQSLSAVSPDYNQLLVSQKLSATYAHVATTRAILESVIGQLGLTGTSDDLAKRIKADASQDSTLLTITVQDSDPARAAAIANAIADKLVAASSAIQGRQTELQKSIDADLLSTQAQVAATQKQVDALLGLFVRTTQQDTNLQILQAQLTSLRSTYATLLTFSSSNASNQLSVIDPAVPPTQPISPKVLVNVAIAALLGLMLAVAFAFAADHLDDRVKNAEAVGDVVGLATVGSIARIDFGRGTGEPARLEATLSALPDVAEAYRTLRANIEFASARTPIHTLLVTSSVSGEGKTITAASLAVAFARSGRTVLLVDAHLRRPGIHTVFDLPNAKGLSTVLGNARVKLDALAGRPGQENLRVLTTGPLLPNPADLIDSPRMREALSLAGADSALVVIDGPALDEGADAAILSSFVDGTLLVVDAGRTHRRDVLRGRDALAKAGANVIGVVLNRVPAPRRDLVSRVRALLARRHRTEGESSGTAPA